jgi:hypothetical protein
VAIRRFYGGSVNQPPTALKPNPAGPAVPGYIEMGYKKSDKIGSWNGPWVIDGSGMYTGHEWRPEIDIDEMPINGFLTTDGGAPLYARNGFHGGPRYHAAPNQQSHSGTFGLPHSETHSPLLRLRSTSVSQRARAFRAYQGIPDLPIKFPDRLRDVPDNFKKFPVILSREFGCNPLNWVFNFGTRIRRKGHILPNSLLFSLLAGNLRRGVRF